MVLIQRDRRRPRRRLLQIGGIAAGGVLLLLIAGSHKPQPKESPPPPDAAPTPTPVPPGQRLIFTYYYYWYDSVTGGHLTEASGLRYHLPPSPAPTWRSVAWHQKQLSDMRYAGIDVALPVYWGFDRPGDEWSWLGLNVLAQAWDGMLAAGTQPPRIGMFFDTTIVDNRDLTTPDGKSFFYANLHDFFTRIPRHQWVLVNGSPVVFLFTSDWTSAVNQSTFDDVSDRFFSDFGTRPYIVREVSWDYPILRWQNGVRIRDYQHPIHTANSYLWGAAMHGYVDRGGVAAVGPGYDDRLIPGRAGTVTDRQGGAFYRKALQEAIASGKPLLAIETWNEIHEGSCICDTVEFGRQYMDITRQFSATFHAAK